MWHAFEDKTNHQQNEKGKSTIRYLSQDNNNKNFVSSQSLNVGMWYAYINAASFDYTPSLTSACTRARGACLCVCACVRAFHHTVKQ